MLLNGDLAVNTLKAFHVLALTGRYGGGKTALAFRLAYELLEDGTCEHLVSNVPSVWSEPLESVDFNERNELNTVVIIDEAGVFLKTGRDVDAYLAAMRKMGVYLILPSVLSVPRKVAFFKCRREINYQRIGLPIWEYKYSLYQDGGKDEAKFWWFAPSEIFGVYDTKAMPIDDAGISEWLLDKVSKIAIETDRGTTGRPGGGRVHQLLSPMEESGGEYGDVLEAAEIFSEAAETISLSGQQNKKRRR